MNIHSGLDGIAITVLLTIAFFVLIVGAVRISGKRTTANMNNFDWIVTVAIGSLAASGILSGSVPVAHSAVAILVLLALQWGATRLTARSESFAELIKPAPRILMDDGVPNEDAMLAERISHGEIEAALRLAGQSTLDARTLVVLETNGRLSVLTPAEGAEGAGPTQPLHGLAR